MDRATLNDIFTAKLPALFGCNGFLPLAANCYTPPPPPPPSVSPAADPVASAASFMAESAAAAFEAVVDVPVALNDTKISHPPHPYYPLEVELLGYLANEYAVPQLLAAFAAGCAGILMVTYLVAKRIRPTLRTPELLQIVWFVLCGCIHLFFEGYYVFNFRRLGSSQHLFGQLWKEYSLSDSRYLTEDPFVLCMESITAIFWGPLSFVVAAMITTEHPLRYPLQAIVSLGQLYGDVLYYATALFDHFLMNLSYSRPEAYYFWAYFVLMNAFWIVIPFILLMTSVRASSRAFTALAKMERCLNASPASPKKNKTL